MVVLAWWSVITGHSGGLLQYSKILQYSFNNPVWAQTYLVHNKLVFPSAEESRWCSVMLRT